jgi:hypothetical protein
VTGEPATAVTLVVIMLVSIGLDRGWKRRRPERPVPASDAPVTPVRAPG